MWLVTILLLQAIYHAKFYHENFLNGIVSRESESNDFFSDSTPLAYATQVPIVGVLRDLIYQALTLREIFPESLEFARRCMERRCEAPIAILSEHLQNECNQHLIRMMFVRFIEIKPCSTGCFIWVSSMYCVLHSLYCIAVVYVLAMCTYLCIISILWSACSFSIATFDCLIGIIDLYRVASFYGVCTNFESL